jgi:hypothetical protein
MSGLRNRFVYSCIQIGTWTTRTPLAHPLLHTKSKSIQRKFAMNLALQTRRAVITLSLMALALAWVAAKTTMRHDALSSQSPAHAESIATETVHVSAKPMAIKVAAKTKTRSETHIIVI